MFYLNKIISFVILVMFLFNSVFSNLFAGFVSPSILPISSYATVIEKYDGTSNGKVILIKDLHKDYEVEKNILAFLEILKSEYKENFKILGIEGVDKKGITFKSFEKFKTEEKRDILDKMARLGYLSGAEWYVALNSIDVIGLEERDLYLSNFRNYYKSMNYKDDLSRFFSEVNRGIDRNEKIFFSQETKKLLEKRAEFLDEKISLREYVSYLEPHMEQEKLINFTNYKNQIILDDKKKDIFLDEIEYETKSLIAKLGNYLDKTEKDMLNKKGGEDFYFFLNEILKQKNINIKNYKKLSDYLEYLALKKSIDIENLYFEIEEMEKIAFLNIEKNRKDSNEFLKAKMDLLDIERFLFNKVGSFEQDKINEGIDEKLENSRKFFKKLFYKDYYEDYYDKLQLSINNMKNFYKLANKRNEVMSESVLFSPLKKGEVRAIVLGGYHTDGVKNLFKAKGISYEIILPNFLGERTNLYEKRIREQGERFYNDLDNEDIFDIKNDKLELVSLFANSGLDLDGTKIEQFVEFLVNRKKTNKLPLVNKNQKTLKTDDLEKKYNNMPEDLKFIINLIAFYGDNKDLRVSSKNEKILIKNINNLKKGLKKLGIDFDIKIQDKELIKKYSHKDGIKESFKRIFKITLEKIINLGNLLGVMKGKDSKTFNYYNATHDDEGKVIFGEGISNILRQVDASLQNIGIEGGYKELKYAIESHESKEHDIECKNKEQGITEDKEKVHIKATMEEEDTYNQAIVIVFNMFFNNEKINIGYDNFSYEMVKYILKEMIFYKKNMSYNPYAIVFIAMYEFLKMKNKRTFEQKLDFYKKEFFKTLREHKLKIPCKDLVDNFKGAGFHELLSKILKSDIEKEKEEKEKKVAEEVLSSIDMPEDRRRDILKKVYEEEKIQKATEIKERISSEYLKKKNRQNLKESIKKKIEKEKKKNEMSILEQKTKDYYGYKSENNTNIPNMKNSSVNNKNKTRYSTRYGSAFSSGKGSVKYYNEKSTLQDLNNETRYSKYVYEYKSLEEEEKRTNEELKQYLNEVLPEEELSFLDSLKSKIGSWFSDLGSSNDGKNKKDISKNEEQVKIKQVSSQCKIIHKNNDYIFPIKIKREGKKYDEKEDPINEKGWHVKEKRDVMQSARPMRESAEDADDIISFIKDTIVIDENKGRLSEKIVTEYGNNLQKIKDEVTDKNKNESVFDVEVTLNEGEHWERTEKVFDKIEKGYKWHFNSAPVLDELREKMEGTRQSYPYTPKKKDNSIFSFFNIFKSKEKEEMDLQPMGLQTSWTQDFEKINKMRTVGSLDIKVDVVKKGKDNKSDKNQSNLSYRKKNLLMDLGCFAEYLTYDVERIEVIDRFYKNIYKNKKDKEKKKKKEKEAIAYKSAYSISCVYIYLFVLQEYLKNDYLHDFEKNLLEEIKETMKKFFKYRVDALIERGEEILNKSLSLDIVDYYELKFIIRELGWIQNFGLAEIDPDKMSKFAKYINDFEEIIKNPVRGSTDSKWGFPEWWKWVSFNFWVPEKKEKKDENIIDINIDVINMPKKFDSFEEKYKEIASKASDFTARADKDYKDKKSFFYGNNDRRKYNENKKNEQKVLIKSKNDLLDKLEGYIKKQKKEYEQYEEKLKQYEENNKKYEKLLSSYGGNNEQIKKYNEDYKNYKKIINDNGNILKNNQIVLKNIEKVVFDYNSFAFTENEVIVNESLRGSKASKDFKKEALGRLNIVSKKIKDFLNSIFQKNATNIITYIGNKIKDFRNNNFLKKLNEMFNLEEYEIKVIDNTNKYYEIFTKDNSIYISSGMIEFLKGLEKNTTSEYFENQVSLAIVHEICEKFLVEKREMTHEKAHDTIVEILGTDHENFILALDVLDKYENLGKITDFNELQKDIDSFMKNLNVSKEIALKLLPNSVVKYLADRHSKEELEYKEIIFDINGKSFSDIENYFNKLSIDNKMFLNVVLVGDMSNVKDIKNLTNFIKSKSHGLLDISWVIGKTTYDELEKESFDYSKNENIQIIKMISNGYLVGNGSVSNEVMMELKKISKKERLNSKEIEIYLNIGSKDIKDKYFKNYDPDKDVKQFVLGKGIDIEMKENNILNSIGDNNIKVISKGGTDLLLSVEYSIDTIANVSDVISLDMENSKNIEILENEKIELDGIEGNKITTIYKLKISFQKAIMKFLHHTKLVTNKNMFVNIENVKSFASAA